MENNMAIEEDRQKKRFLELADKAYSKNVYTYTGFLNMSEIDLLQRCHKELSYVPYQLFGGYENSDRQMLRFGSEDLCGYTEEFPVCCIRVRPAAPKFAEELTHRDFLGALLNLGIERNTIGDIIVHEKEAMVYCNTIIAGFITTNLDKVKHTIVKCEEADLEQEETEKRYETISETAASERADIILAKLYRLSRSDALELFRTKKVFINAKLTENNSVNLKKEDVLSVRGYGKFVYDGVQYMNKKGKYVFSVRKYC